MSSQIYWLAAARWPASNPKPLKNIEIKEPNNAMHRTGMCAALKIMSVLHANAVRIQMLPLNHRKNAREKEYIFVSGIFFIICACRSSTTKKAIDESIALHRWIYISLANALRWLKYSIFTGEKSVKSEMYAMRRNGREKFQLTTENQLVGWLVGCQRDSVIRSNLMNEQKPNQ